MKKKKDNHNRSDTADSNFELNASVFENAPVFICRYSEDTILNYVNDSFCRYLDLPKKKLIGTKLIELIHQDDRLRLTKTVNSLCTIGESARLVHKFFITGGQTRFTEWNYSLIENNEEGKLIQGFGSDITDKIKIEEELRLERELFISSPVISVKWKAVPGSPTEYISPNVVDILGYNPEQFVAGDLDLRNLMHPDDAERCREEAIECHNKKADTFRQEYRLRNIKGEYRWYSDFVRLVKDSSGNLIQYQGFIFDINDRKQIEESLRRSEERFRYVSSSLASISFSCRLDESNDYSLDWLYGPSLRITGYTPEELIQNRCWGKIVAKEDFHLFKSHILQVEPGTSDSCQIRIIQKNGNVIWIEATSECVIDPEDPNIKFIYGAIVDINERKLAEEAMKRSEQELRKSNKMKDKFFSIISHDLRSPFQGLIGMANILVEDEELTAEERKEFTFKLYESLKTQFNFIEDLLTWNRIQRGAIEFLPSTDNISSVIQETVDLLRRSIENKQLKLETDIPSNVILVFDRNMIATVVRNLLTNSTKFTRSGGTIKIKLEDQPSNVVVSVKDTGIGMDKSELKKLWEADFHRSTKGTDGEEGTGLGLVLCKEFADKHEGSISAESEIEKGSTFKLTIPKNLRGTEE